MEEKIIGIEPEVSFALGASGSFDPEYNTRMLGIQPTVARKKGDKVGHAGEPEIRFDAWDIYSPKTRGYKFVDYLLDFLNSFEGKEEIFKHLLEKDSISFYLIAYISMFHGMERPELRLEKTLMQRLIDFGFILDVVIYCECCDSEEEDNDG